VRGEYPKAKAAKYELYRDANRNRKFDDVDEMLGYSINIILQYDDYYLSRPIKLSDEYCEGSLFVRVISGIDTTISEIPGCSASTSEFSSL
jgi:hypothetical protein